MVKSLLTSLFTSSTKNDKVIAAYETLNKKTKGYTWKKFLEVLEMFLEYI